MRVLLDECVPRRLAQAFGPEHAVATVTRQGWAGTKNGELLQLAADHGFEAFVTVDVGLHVSPDASLCVLVLRAGSNRLEALLPLMQGEPDPIYEWHGVDVWAPTLRIIVECGDADPARNRCA